MSESSLGVLLGSAAVGWVAVLVLALALVIKRQSAAQKIRQLEAALVAAEARATRTQVDQSTAASKKSKKERASLAGALTPPQPEVVSLRREVAALRSQVASLRTDAKEQGTKVREAVRAKEIEVEQLSKDRDHLIETIKEMEIQRAEVIASRAPRGDGMPVVRESRGGDGNSAKLEELTRKIALLERSLQAEKERTQALRAEGQNLQAEVRKWTHWATDDEGKPLDPQMFKKWKDRALTARVQYQMMRQLREMSDIKLSTYQSSVVRLAKYVFESTGTQAPPLRRGEVESDRYLAEALAALSERREEDEDALSQGQGNAPDA